MRQDTLQHISPSSAKATPTAETTKQTSIAPVAVRSLGRAAKSKLNAEKADTLPQTSQPLPQASCSTSVAGVTFPYNDYWKSHELVEVSPTPFTQQLDSICGTGQKTLQTQPWGKESDPVAYRFRSDNFVTLLLLLSFFLMAWVVARSRHYLTEQFKDFFCERERNNLFSERTQRELSGQLFLIFQACFAIGLLFFDFTQVHQPAVFAGVSPYQILGVGVLSSILYYLVKVGLYASVNSVFFERQQVRRWTDVYMLCILSLGVALLPIALLVVYFSLSYNVMAILFLLALLVNKIVLLYKCFQIFFKGAAGLMHVFLYFCTLEIVPLLVLVRLMMRANLFLLAIN